MKRVSYPTKSLRFLSGLKTTNDGMTETPQSRIRLKVIIAGAGLGGLATAVALARTGHSVRVFERAPILAEVCIPATVSCMIGEGYCFALSRKLKALQNANPKLRLGRRGYSDTSKLQPSSAEMGSGSFCGHASG